MGKKVKTAPPQRRRAGREIDRRFLVRYALAAALVLATGAGLGFGAGYWVAETKTPGADVHIDLPTPKSPAAETVSTTTSRQVSAKASIEITKPAARKDGREPVFQTPPKQPAAAAIEPAWQRFAVAHALTDSRPIIAIVLDDMGLDRHNAARAIGLRAPLTLAFMSYADDLDRQIAVARESGHEIMLHVPMEPVDAHEDPGPNVLLLDHDEAELRRRLNWVLDRAEGYVGVNNHMGSRFTRDEAAMGIVMAALERRGLAFLDSRTTNESVAEIMADRFSVPVISRDVFLDNEPAPDKIEAQLARVEEIARRQGHAVAIGHPRAATLDILERWLATIEARGFHLAPMSAIWRRHEERTSAIGDHAPGSAAIAAEVAD